MQLTILLEPVNGRGYRASGGEPFHLSVEGASREEALQKLQSEIQARISGGAEVIVLNLPVESNPWLRIAGMYKDDPMFEAWQQAIADYRDEVEKDDDYP
jgi:hypothetical protein